MKSKREEKEKGLVEQWKDKLMNRRHYESFFLQKKYLPNFVESWRF